MRTAFLTLTVVALVASSMTAASAFNFATMQRDVGVGIVTDNGNAYLSILKHDPDYECLISYAGGGEFTVSFNGGSECGDSRGTGVNPDAEYYFRDVLKITNKGAKDIVGLWINMSDGVVLTHESADAGMEILTTDGWAQNNALGALAKGATVYVSFKIDTRGVALGTPTKTMTIEARAAHTTEE